MAFENSVSLLFPFTAGIFALLSPCSYALLPAYVSYCLGTTTSVRKSILGGVSALLGLLTVFTLVGIFSGLFGEAIRPYSQTYNLIGGVLVILLGISLILNLRFPSVNLSRGIKVKKNVLGLYSFGLAYGLAVTSCTAPILLSVALYAMSMGGIAQAVLACGFYAFGAGIPLIITAVLTTQSKKLVLQRIKYTTPILHRLAGLVVVAAGVYLIYFYFTWL